MSVLQCTPMNQMSVGVAPRAWRILTDDTFATVSTTGYLTNIQTTFGFSNGDFANVYTTDLLVVMFNITVSTAGVVSLIPMPAGEFDGVALTRVNDTNVTVTLGGDPTNALVKAASLTLGWTGTLAVARGGSGAATLTGILTGNGTSAFTASTVTQFGVVVGGASNAVASTAVGATGTILQGNTGAAPTYSTATYPSTTTINQILYSSSANVIAGIATANSGVLITSAGGVPSISVTLPSGIAATNMALTTPVLGVASATSVTLTKTNGTEAANAVTASGSCGVITTSALTTAAGSSYAITWTNTSITSTSTVLLSVQGGTNTRQSFRFTIVPGSGTATLTIYNNEPTNALNGTILIGYTVH